MYKIRTIEPLEGNNISLATSNTIKFKINNNKIQPSSINLHFNDKTITALADTVFSRYIDFLPFINKIRVYDEENNNNVFFDCDSIDKYSKLHRPLTKNYLNNNLHDGYLMPSQRTVLNNVDNQFEQDPLMPYTDSIDVSFIYSIKNKYDTIGLKYSSDINTDLLKTYYRINLNDLIPDSIFGINKYIYLKNYIIEITFFDYKNIYSQCDNDPIGVEFIQDNINDLGLENICLKFNEYISEPLLEINDELELDFFETMHFTDNTIYLNNIINNTDVLTKIIFGYFKKDLGVLYQYMSNTLYYSDADIPQIINSYSIYYNNDLLKQIDRTKHEDFNDVLNIVNKNETSIINYDIFKIFNPFVLLFDNNINSKKTEGLILDNKKLNILRFEYDTDITDKFDYFVSIHKKYVIKNGKIYKDKI